ncbi:hypothetical protein [Schumannella soli]|uniref:Flagellar protein FlgN n=1 Tax=Schumannella soli TaxID=2590779 RepID=A0A506Y3L8_9MICO|nr:hypothetical protein [Schumannella soli]TPW75029.1 hypothetical protein FJ657_12475 [Schumannella soli]
MADLKYDLELLGQLRDDLQLVLDEFTDADDISDAVGEDTGHDELKDRVHDFAHKWNDKRKEMLEAITTLQGQIAQITDNFTKVDKELAKALEEGADSGDKAYPPPGRDPE